MKKLLFFITLFFASTISLSAQDYCPIGIGDNWTYYFEATGLSSGTDSLVRTIVGDTVYQNKRYLVVEQLMQGMIIDTQITYFLSNEENDVIYIESLDLIGGTTSPGQIEKFGQHIYSDDDIWVSSTNDTAEIDFIGDYLMNEESYQNCYKSTSSSSTGDSTFIFYAPNIGMLKTYTKFADNDRFFSWFLVDYNISSVSNSKTPTNLQTNPYSLFSLKQGSILEFHVLGSIKSRINIFSLNGRKIFSKDISNILSLNLMDTNISNGTYMIEVILGNMVERRAVSVIK